MICYYLLMIVTMLMIVKEFEHSDVRIFFSFSAVFYIYVEAVQNENFWMVLILLYY